MCYCKTSGGDLRASISAAETKIPAAGSDITEAESKKAATEAALKEAQVDRDSAIAAMKEATALREKEAAVFSGEKAELDADIAAIAKAVAALEKGKAGSFLQSPAAGALRAALAAKQDLLLDEDRQELLAFLTASTSQGAASGYAPQGGEITGILSH